MKKRGLPPIATLVICSAALGAYAIGEPGSLHVLQEAISPSQQGWRKPCDRQEASVWQIRTSHKVAIALDCEQSTGWKDLYFETADLGKTWQQVDRTAVLADPTKLGPHPADPRIAYRLGGAQELRFFLERSEDNGKTWRRVRALIYGTSQVLEDYGFLAYHPRDPATVYVQAHLLGSKTDVARSGQMGLFVSHDGGDTFSLLVGSISPFTFAISESRPETLYVGTFNEYLLRSENGGMTWQFIGPCGQKAGDCHAASDSIEEEPTARRSISHVVVHPRNHRVVYACAGDGIWKTEDGGRHWCRVKPASEVNSVRELVVATKDAEEVVFAGTDRGVFVSHDSARTWSRLNLDDDQ